MLPAVQAHEWPACNLQSHPACSAMPTLSLSLSHMHVAVSRRGVPAPCPPALSSLSSPACATTKWDASALRVAGVGCGTVWQARHAHVHHLSCCNSNEIATPEAFCRRCQYGTCSTVVASKTRHDCAHDTFNVGTCSCSQQKCKQCSNKLSAAGSDSEGKCVQQCCGGIWCSTGHARCTPCVAGPASSLVPCSCK